MTGRVRKRAAARVGSARTLFAALLVGALVGGCNVAAVVDISVRASGAGSVHVQATADKQAASQFGDPKVGVRLGDLRAAGWTVAEPVLGADGSLTISVQRDFASVAEGQAVLARLSGSGGPLRDMTLSKTTGLGRSRVELSGVADLSGGLSVLSDASLAQALGGDPLGAPINDLVDRYEVSEHDAFSLTVRARVGEKVASESVVAAGERKDFSAHASQWSLGRLAFGAICVALALAGLGLAGVSLLHGRSRPR